MKRKITLILILILTQFIFADDGIKEIKIPKYKPNNIINSPIDDNIWIIDQNKASYEYNCQTGELFNLADKFGDFAYGLKDMIIEDRFDSDLVWLGNFQKGVLCYHKSSKEYHIYSKPEYFIDEAITLIKPDIHKVWIGTSNNLYYYDRDNKEISKSGFYKTVWVKELQKEEDNLIINNTYKYNLNDNTIIKINYIYSYNYTKADEFKEYTNFSFFKDDDYKSVFVGKDIQPYVINHYISHWNMVVDNYRVYYPEKGDLVVLDLQAKDKKIIRIGGIYNLYQDDKYIWFFDKFGLGRLNKVTYKIEKSNISFPIVRSFLANDEYIWIGIDDGFVQISKYYLANALKPKALVQHNEAAIEAKRKELKREKDPFKFAKGFFDLKEMTTSEKIINNLKRRLQYIFRIRESEDIERFESVLVTENDPKIIEAIFYGLICGYSLNGYPQKALEYHKKLHTLNDRSIFLEFVGEHDLERLRKAVVQLDALKVLNIIEAERLFQLGEIYYEMFKLSWNRGEVGINTEFPFKFYQQVLDLYPESEWADNAKYTMLRYNLMVSSEGGDNSSHLKYIGIFNDFLERYSETDLELLIRCDIISLYYSLMKGAGRGNLSPIDIEYLAKADSLLKLIPESYTEYDHIDYLRKGITEDYAKYRWEFKMQLDSTTFTQEDSIHISFSIKNRNDTTQQISLKKEDDIPNFGIYINKRRYDNKYRVKVPFVEDREIDDLEDQIYLIGVDEIYAEDWDITQKIKVNHNKAIGHYETLEKGLYQIKGYFVLERNMILLTDPVFIKIE